MVLYSPVKPYNCNLDTIWVPETTSCCSTLPWQLKTLRRKFKPKCIGFDCQFPELPTTDWTTSSLPVLTDRKFKHCQVCIGFASQFPELPTTEWTTSSLPVLTDRKFKQVCIGFASQFLGQHHHYLGMFYTPCRQPVSVIASYRKR